MKTKALNILILLLIGVAAWQGGRIYESKNNPTDYTFLDEEGLYHDFNLFNDGRIFPIKSVADYKGYQHRFDSIAQSTDLFVFMDMAGCPPCREMVFKQMDRFLDNNPDTSISILVKSMRSRDMFVMEKEFKNKYRFFMIDTIPFNSPEKNDEILSPVFFRIDKNIAMNNCYMTEISNEKGLTDYLESFRNIK